MKRFLILVMLATLPPIACSIGPTPDIEATVGAAVAATQTARPTLTAISTPEPPKPAFTPASPTAPPTPIPPTPIPPASTPTGVTVGTPIIGHRGEWELTVLSVAYRDSITFALGEAKPNEGETFLVVEFSLRSLGQSEVTVFRPDWFQVTDTDGHAFPAHTFTDTNDFQHIFSSGRLTEVEYPQPTQELGRLLMFPIPTSAEGLALEFTGVLDEFPPVYLGE